MPKRVRIILVIMASILIIDLTYLNVKVFEIDKLLWGNIIPKAKVYKVNVKKILEKIGLIHRVNLIDNLESRIDDVEYRVDDLETGKDNLEGRADDMEAKMDDLESRAEDLEAITDDMKRILRY